jgi:hypothetical protein
MTTILSRNSNIIAPAGYIFSSITPALWTPAQLGSALALWLDADDASTITLNGSNVSQWNDKSGNARHVSQAVGTAQPLRVLDAQNGRAIIRTDGGDRLENTTSNLFRNVNSATWVAVGKYPTTAPVANGMLLFCSTPTAVSTTRLGLTANPSPGGEFMSIVGRRLDGDSYATAPSSTPRIANSWFVEVGQANYSAGQANHWTNGTQDLTAAEFQTAGNTSDTNPTLVAVFGPPTLAARNGTEIAEAIALHGPLSTNDRQKLEGYLAHKWGIAANLPNDHQYKTAPPTV